MTPTDPSASVFVDPLSQDDALRQVVETMQCAPLHLLRRALQQNTKTWQDAAPPLSPPQYAALFAIGHVRGLNQSRLSDIVAIDPSTLTEMLRRLEKRGVLRRFPDPDNNRSTLLDITPQGEEELRLSVAASQSVTEAVAAKLTPDEGGQLMALLRKLIG